MRILGCNAFVDFISNQTDSMHMFHLEGLIPKLCQLAQEVGDDERALRLRSAGLQTMAFMVWFMGEHSHISMDFDTVSSLASSLCIRFKPEQQSLLFTELYRLYLRFLTSVIIERQGLSLNLSLLMSDSNGLSLLLFFRTIYLTYYLTEAPLYCHIVIWCHNFPNAINLLRVIIVCGYFLMPCFISCS